MDKREEIIALGDLMIHHPGQIETNVEYVLERLAEIGLVEKFSTAGGNAIAYGLPTGPHQHQWYRPEVQGRNEVHYADPSITVRWWCKVPGCKETQDTQVHRRLA